MATDVYVMPMWMFRSGDVESSLSAFARKSGISFKVVRPAPMPSPAKMLRKFFARRYVQEVQRRLSKAIGKPAQWNDEGKVHYNHQFHGHGLWDYAFWFDYRDELPEFVKWNADTRAIFSVPKAQKTFPMVLNTHFYAGYIVPVDFPEVVRLKESVRGESYERRVSSAPALLREIERINAFLQVPEDWDHKTFPPNLFPAMFGLYELREILRLSVQHQLPVMFDG